MKLGIIGTGMIVTEFLPHLKTIDKLSVNALLSTPRSLPKAKEMAEQYEIPFFTDDYEAFAKADIDTVYVAVPNHLHYSYSLKALENGLNVIVEKPITSSLKEVRDLQKTAQEKGLFLFEAISTLYLEGYQKIREWLPEIGEIKIAQSQYSQYSRRYDAFRQGEILPAFDPNKSGGALMDLNLYNIFYILGLFGKPVSRKYFANMERGIDTSGILVLQYPGFQALCVAAKDSRGMRQGMIQGTKGVISSYGSANVGGKIVLDLNDGTTREFESDPSVNRVIYEFREFIRAIEEDDKDFCYGMLETSVAVSEVMTSARKDAGIVFAADQ